MRVFLHLIIVIVVLTGCTSIPALKETSVTFPFGSSVLSNAQKTTLKEIAQDITYTDAYIDIHGNYKLSKRPYITLVGHTDTVGDHKANLSLSKRRAESVKSTLVEYGLSPHCIAIWPRGETSLEIKTGDNIKEQKNRRVDIYISY